MNNDPLVIRLKEAEEEIISFINSVMREKSLPCYLVAPITEKAHRQTMEGAKREYESAKVALAEQEKEGVDDESNNDSHTDN